MSVYATNFACEFLKIISFLHLSYVACVLLETKLLAFDYLKCSSSASFNQQYPYLKQR